MMRRLKFFRLVALGALLVCVKATAQYQNPVSFPTDPLPPPKPKRPSISTYLPDKPTLAPSTQIALAPLGFVPPRASSYYLGRQIHLLSLDFLDENRVLFTFHPSGLMVRDTEDAGVADQRQVKALVLHLPDGKVEADATWTVSDRSRYLWALEDSKFLLLTGDGLEEGNQKLELTPVRNLHGKLLALDPSQQVMIAASTEPPPASPNQQTGASSVSQSQFAPTGMSSDDQADLLVHAIERSSGRVIATFHAESVADLPFNTSGYVEASPPPPKKHDWVLTLKSFSGESKVLAKVQSGCVPVSSFLTGDELFVTTCTPIGGLQLAVLTTEDGKTLWATDGPPEAVWPLLVIAPDGSRLAREALVPKEGVNLKKHPKFAKAIQGQDVKVIDAANGKVVFEAPLSPILDGGGNVAFSPSGRRFAIVIGGAIQVFDLPAAAARPALPAPPSSH